jgi:hypothetical protein
MVAGLLGRRQPIVDITAPPQPQPIVDAQFYPVPLEVGSLHNN